MRAVSRTLSMAAGTLAVMSIHTGCGDSGTERFLPPLEGGGNLACADGEFRLVGTIGSQSIDHKDSSGGGGWVRINPANFDTQYSSLAEDPTRARLSLEWTDDIMKDTFNATGTLLMGTGNVLAGQSFCLGAGTMVNFATEDVLEFKLESLTAGAGCTEAVSGSLIGCFR
jgi:hypothetical protein